MNGLHMKNTTEDKREEIKQKLCQYYDGRQMPCQDNKRIVEISDKIAIVAVVDGHGSLKCPRSDRGAIIAVNSFYEGMKNYLKIYGEDKAVFLCQNQMPGGL